ncbi:MAG: hypothetical protein ACSLFI_07410 [Solirubrobacterales bacterium]
MAGDPVTRPVHRTILAAALLAFSLALFVVPAGSAEAAQCFGKKVNRVISGDDGKHRLEFKDVTYISGENVTVIAKPYSRICAGDGRQIIRAGKGWSRTDAGPGNDRIILHRSSTTSRAYGGLGDDRIEGARGHDFLYGGPKKNPGEASDTDTILGLGGNDRIFDYTGEVNRLIGGTGSDRIYSLGNAVSDVHGSGGTDFIWFTGGRTDDGRLERIFGEQGNDRMRGNTYPTNGPAYIDGGEGDDRSLGTDADDVLLTNSGIKTIRGFGGDDLIVTASKGLADIDGGSGSDTISYATHTPAGNRGVGGLTGVTVNLSDRPAFGLPNGNHKQPPHSSLGQTTYQLKGLENVIGSSFEDQVMGAVGQRNVIEGGLGNDELVGQGRDGDTGDGGLGTNDCQGFDKATNCNGDSPGDTGSKLSLLDINEGGVLTLIGSRSADGVSVGYSDGAYRISVQGGAIPAGLCEPAGQSQTSFICPAGINTLNGMLLYGNDGGDDISLENSIPRNVTTTINGGDGENHIVGGPSKDFISTSIGRSAGSVIEGRNNFDVLYINDNVRALGGKGGDGIHIHNPCAGGESIGGTDTDSTIFAGADRGVEANIAGGYARWSNGGCANRLRIDNTIEKLEGTAHNDHLILGKRMRAQQGKSSLLGREGRNVLNSRNGVRDTVTTGPAARANKVIADRKDKVIYGWGLASF